MAGVIRAVLDSAILNTRSFIAAETTADKAAARWHGWTVASTHLLTIADEVRFDRPATDAHSVESTP